MHACAVTLWSMLSPSCLGRGYVVEHACDDCVCTCACGRVHVYVCIHMHVYVRVHNAHRRLCETACMRPSHVRTYPYVCVHADGPSGTPKETSSTHGAPVKSGEAQEGGARSMGGTGSSQDKTEEILMDATMVR